MVRRGVVLLFLPVESVAALVFLFLVALRFQLPAFLSFVLGVLLGFEYEPFLELLPYGRVPVYLPRVGIQVGPLGPFLC